MKPCAPISSPFLTRRPRRPAADPHPTAQVILRLVSYRGGAVRPALQLPVQRINIQQQHKPINSSFSLATEYLPIGHELCLTLALPRRGRKKRLAELEELLRLDVDVWQEAHYFDVLVLDSQGTILYWHTYHGYGAWRMARVGDDALSYGDTVTFSEGMGY